MYGKETCVGCGEDAITEKCKRCGRKIARDHETCNNNGVCRDKDSCKAARLYELTKNKCPECGGELVGGEGAKTCIHCRKVFRTRAKKTARRKR